MVQPGDSLTRLGQAGPADLKYRLPHGACMTLEGIGSQSKVQFREQQDSPHRLKDGSRERE